MVVLTLKAKHDHLQKVASTRDYVKALAEFVWNALDADATEVSVDLIRNALGGLESFLIRDNGTGISRKRAEHDFESLGESWKLHTSRTPVLSHAVHGKEGQGRLRFFSLARRACWNSVYKEGKGRRRLTIEINADRLDRSNVSDPEPAPSNAETGTVVELAPLKDTFDWLTSEDARAEFNAIFAPYVLQYSGTVIIYDSHPVDPVKTIDRAQEIRTQPIICPNRVVRDMSLRVIEWKARIGNRKIYFGGESGVVLGSQVANITAPGFDFSVYAYSLFFQEIANANLLEIDGLTDPDFAHILEFIREKVGDYFRTRQAEAGLTKVMNRVFDELALKRSKGKARKLDGTIGRIDSFMGRVVPHADRQHREFLLVELKRPSLVVGRREVDQLEDYVNAILSQPDFINTSTFWNFYLITGEYDDVVKERVTQKERPVGLYLDKPNHKVWVKTWAELIRDCECRLDFVQEKLQIEVSVEEIAERIAQLKASILRLGLESPATPLFVRGDGVSAEAPSPASLSLDRRANKTRAIS